MKNRINDDRTLGFDNGEYIVDEKKERFYHARIWIFVGTIAILIFLSLIYSSISETILHSTGTMIELDYKNGSAYGTLEDGSHIGFDLSGQNVLTRDGKIRLYYTDNVYSAKPETDPMFYIKSFSVFGILSLICVLKIYRIYHPKLHYKEN